MHAGLGGSGGDGPAGRLQEREPPRLRRLRRPLGAGQAGRAGIAADALRNLVGDLPGVLQRGGEDPGAALALVVVAAFAVERADRRLEADAAAEARGPQRRADHLGAEARADHAARDGGGGAAARAARRVLEIPGIARAARLGSGKFGGNGLAHNDGACGAQCRDASRIFI